MSPPKRGRAPALLTGLTRRIARAGPLTVAEYMHACLADPRHGYWQKPVSIGAAGDFITAPEISQIFGELIGLWCAVVWHDLGRPACVRLVELGPGRGTLMRDALRAARAVPAFLAAASVHLIEASAPLRAVQRWTLRGAAPQGSAAERPPPGFSPEAKGAANLAAERSDAPAIAWHETLAGVPRGPAIIVGNEFLDALPIRQLVFSRCGWHERVVAGDGRGGLRFAIGAMVAASAAGATPRPGDICELREGEDALFAALAQRPCPLAALFLDYGPAEEAFGDTLQAVSGHAYVDPLQNPGAADLTAHVQFAALRRKAGAAGLAADGPIPQAQFLGRLGIAERAARLMAANPRRAGEIETGVGRLMSPTGMGGLVKAMAVRSQHLPPPIAFL